MPTTVHILGLAHLPSIEADPVWACAYTQKQIRMCRMLETFGYRTVFYGVEGTKVDASETVICLSEEERFKAYGPLDSFKGKQFEHGKYDPAYITFTNNAIREIKERVEPGDIAINPMGNYYEKVFQPEKKGGIEKSPGTPFLVEGGIGYTGILRNCHHVFESDAWRGYVYGMHGINHIDYYDTVIPNFYDPGHFKFSATKEDYFLHISRQAIQKGVLTSKAVIEAIDGHLIVAGQPGEVPPEELVSKNVEYRGYINEEEKLDLISHAKALILPTHYFPPFEGVTVEAMFSGTPVIVTNIGCFTETVPHEGVGFRCYTLKDFVRAAQNVSDIDPRICRTWAQSKFSMEVCVKQYDSYFDRLIEQFGKGWYELD